MALVDEMGSRKFVKHQEPVREILKIMGELIGLEEKEEEKGKCILPEPPYHSARYEYFKDRGLFSPDLNISNPI